jgi:hypothetical protein
VGQIAGTIAKLMPVARKSYEGTTAHARHVFSLESFGTWTRTLSGETLEAKDSMQLQFSWTTAASYPPPAFSCFMPLTHSPDILMHATHCCRSRNPELFLHMFWKFERLVFLSGTAMLWKALDDSKEVGNLHLFSSAIGRQIVQVIFKLLHVASSHIDCSMWLLDFGATTTSYDSGESLRVDSNETAMPKRMSATGEVNPHHGRVSSEFKRYS